MLLFSSLLEVGLAQSLSNCWRLSGDRSSIVLFYIAAAPLSKLYWNLFIFGIEELGVARYAA